jgi:hypothetical protein
MNFLSNLYVVCGGGVIPTFPVELIIILSVGVPASIDFTLKLPS